MKKEAVLLCAEVVVALGSVGIASMVATFLIPVETAPLKGSLIAGTAGILGGSLIVFGVFVLSGILKSVTPQRKMLLRKMLRSIFLTAMIFLGIVIVIILFLHS